MCITMSLWVPRLFDKLGGYINEETFNRLSIIKFWYSVQRLSQWSESAIKIVSPFLST